MSATILQFGHDYVIEASKTVDGQLETYRETVRAANMSKAWEQADKIGKDNHMECWLVWRKERPEAMPR